MHYVQKNNLLFARLPGVSANSKSYNFQAFTNISGNFQNLNKKLQRTVTEAYVSTTSYLELLHTQSSQTCNVLLQRPMPDQCCAILS